MVDAEFAVQYLVLSQAAQHPGLVANAGNIALLQYAENVRLIPAQIGHAAAVAYRELRRLQHTSRLDEGNGRVEEAVANHSRDAITALWDAVFQPRAATTQ
jgi:[glutamine synthetase] adenylyltransferase / [glutamine synthetase]-adenylyl-L-tyrosine phosphorylase